MAIEQVSIESQINVHEHARIKGGVDLEMCKVILRHHNKTADIDDVDATATMHQLCHMGVLKHNMLEDYEFWTPVKDPEENPDLYFMGEKIPDSKPLCDAIRNLGKQVRLAFLQIADRGYDKSMMDAAEVVVYDLSEGEPIGICFSSSEIDGTKPGVTIYSKFNDEEDY